MEILTNNHKYDNIDESAGSAADSFLVTDIKQGIKNPNRANIFINNRYSFSLDIAQIVDFKLRKGQILTPAKLDDYKKASAFGKLYQRTLEWVLTRPHSIRETRDYLNRKTRNISSRERSFAPVVTGLGRSVAPRRSQMSLEKNSGFSNDYSQDPESLVSLRTISSAERPRVCPKRNLVIPDNETDIEEIISRLIEKGYLDDQKFAEYYVENRFVKKGISQKRLRLELVKKGVDKQIIDDVLSANTRTDEEEIKKIIAKKRTKYDDDKLIQYLVRQGFDYALSKTLVLEMDSQN